MADADADGDEAGIEVSEGHLRPRAAAGCHGPAPRRGVEELGRKRVGKRHGGGLACLLPDSAEEILRLEGGVGLRMGKGAKVTADDFGAVHTRQQSCLSRAALGKPLDSKGGVE
jgi:hypothetical protein